MQPFRKHTGMVAALDRPNVDTDQIIPKQFLKRIERSGFGQFLFFDWRFLESGQPNPEFALNWPHSAGASLLLTRQNFGSGSSREHAVWALADYGFRAVLAPSYADIFYNNCFQNGLLPVVLADAEIEDLFQRALSGPLSLTVDLEPQLVTGDGFVAAFQIDPSRKHRLMEGLDSIGLTLQHEQTISDYEAAHPLPPL